MLVLHFYSENNLLKTNAGQDRSGYSNFDGFLFSIPLKSGIGMAMQLRPLTRAHYSMTSRNTLDGHAYAKSVTGSGGINAVSLSAFWRVARFAALGVSGNYLFGRINEEWKVIWDDSLFTQSND
ncbi:MAG TPA: hypothetical protein VGB38_04760, partial [bacterium]